MTERDEQVLYDSIKQWEGEHRDASGKHVAYPDVGDVLTLGYGHTGPEVKEGVLWTDKQADEALKKDVATAVAHYDRLVKVDQNDNQRAAIISLIYNVGGKAFGKSNALAALNSGDEQGFLKEAFDAETGFVKATTTDPATGKREKRVVQGLINRRGHEQVLYSTVPEEIPPGFHENFVPPPVHVELKPPPRKQDISPLERLGKSRIQLAINGVQSTGFPMSHADRRALLREGALNLMNIENEKEWRKKNNNE